MKLLFPEFFKNKCRIKQISFERFYNDDKELKLKLQKLAYNINQGFILYKKNVLQKFIIGYREIDDFTYQFINLYQYNQNNNKSANTLEKFCINYGVTIGTEKFKNKSDLVRGELNPGFNHGGKFSPFSAKSICHSEETRKLVKEKIKVKKLLNPSSKGNTTIEYYLERGHSLDEARILLSSRQKTFSLDICIKKYGLEDGTEIFNKRQEKWQKTLNLKSQDEKDKMNKAKGKSSLGHVGFRLKNLSGFAEKMCKLYYIRFFNEELEFWKIGVTLKDIDKRFWKNEKHGLCFEVLLEDNGNYKDMYMLEQRILKKFNDYRISIEYKGFESSECFSKDVLTLFQLVGLK